MIGDRARQEIILNTVSKPLQAQLRVNISGGGVPVEQLFEDRAHGIYVTQGVYKVSWKPSVKFHQKKSGDYIVYCDMYGHSKTHRFWSWEDFVAYAKTDEVTKFLLQWTNISDRLFAVAAENKTVMIPFCFDAARYVDYLGEITCGANQYLGSPMEMEAAAAGRLEYKQALIDKKIVAEKLRKSAAREKKK